LVKRYGKICTMYVKNVGLKQHSLDNRDLCNIPRTFIGVVWLLNKFKKRIKSMTAALFLLYARALPQKLKSN